MDIPRYTRNTPVSILYTWEGPLAEVVGRVRYTNLEGEEWRGWSTYISLIKKGNNVCHITFFKKNTICSYFISSIFHEYLDLLSIHKIRLTQHSRKCLRKGWTYFTNILPYPSGISQHFLSSNYLYELFCLAKH